jgi:hypothetical protein
MKVPGLRSPTVKLAGLVHFARMLDKIRLHEAGKLPPEYLPNLGLSVGLDGHLCGFLDVEFDAIVARVRAGDGDEQVAEWCFQHGLRPSKIQGRVWNEFARKFGWNDAAGRFLQRIIAEDGITHPPDPLTSFALIDLRESEDTIAPQA